MKLAKGNEIWRYRIASVVILIAVWWLASFIVHQFHPRADVILPSPVTVITQDLPGLSVFADGQTKSDWGQAAGVIAKQTGISMMRLVAGTLLGIFAGILVGLAIGWNKWMRALFEPVILIVRTIPILALIPLFLVWFGGNEKGNIVYIAFAVFTMIVINTLEAIRNVQPVYINFSRTLGASKFQTYRTVVLPAIVPELVGGIRVVIGFSWAILLAAEYLASQAGLGRILIMAEHWLFTGRMIVVILFIMVYSLLLNWLFLKAIQRITRWMPQ